MIDIEKATNAMRMFLEAIGEDPDREGLKETPKRVANMYSELTAGYDDSPSKHLTKVFSSENSELVVLKDIEFFSLCEHHLLPFFGKVHIAYIPNSKVVGLSKLARCVETYSRRLQIQEKLTTQIADSIDTILSPLGLIVIIEAEHTCMSMRGIKKIGAKTLTLATRGKFVNDSNLKKEVLDLIK